MHVISSQYPVKWSGTKKTQCNLTAPSVECAMIETLLDSRSFISPIPRRKPTSFFHLNFTAATDLYSFSASPNSSICLSVVWKDCGYIVFVCINSSYSRVNTQNTPRGIIHDRTKAWIEKFSTSSQLHELLTGCRCIRDQPSPERWDQSQLF